MNFTLYIRFSSVLAQVLPGETMDDNGALSNIANVVSVEMTQSAIMLNGTISIIIINVYWFLILQILQEIQQVITVSCVQQEQ